MASSGNFCTWNAAHYQGGSGSTTTFSYGSCRVGTTSGGYPRQISNFAFPASGKWYIELNNIVNNGYHVFGIIRQENMAYGNGLFNNTGQYHYQAWNGQKRGNGGSAQSYGSSWQSVGDIIGLAFDADNGKIWWAKNNTWQASGDPAGNSNEAFSGIDASDTYYFGWSDYYTNQAGTVHINCGQDSSFGGSKTSGSANATDDNGFGDFYYAPPSGFLGLCTANLPISADIDPAQTDNNYPSKNFNVVTYDSTGSGQSITGVGFQPDLVWIKCRSVAQGNGLFDSNRGTSKVLQSDATSAENTSSGLTSFDSDGYTMGQYYNQSGREYVGWCWKAGGTASSDSSGDITVSRSTNDAAKFSILTYTGNGSSGSTIAHGLGVKPAMTIIKERGGSNGWNVWHQGNNNGDYDSFGELNGSAAWYQNQGSNGPFSAAPGTDYLTLTAYGQVNNSSDTYVAYVWADVEGMQKFGSWEGNANDSGTFVYTGFRPKMLFIKSVDTVAPWVVWDTERAIANPANNALAWNVTNTEADYTGYPVDILSNGFKLRTSNITVNASGTWVYGAWGDVPFRYNNSF